MWEEELREEELLMAQPEQLFTRCFQAPLFDSTPFFFSPLARPLVREHCNARKSVSMRRVPPKTRSSVACTLFSRAKHNDTRYTSRRVSSECETGGKDETNRAEEGSR